MRREYGDDTRTARRKLVGALTIGERSRDSFNSYFSCIAWAYAPAHPGCSLTRAHRRCSTSSRRGCICLRVGEYPMHIAVFPQISSHDNNKRLHGLNEVSDRIHGMAMLRW